MPKRNSSVAVFSLLSLITCLARGHLYAAPPEDKATETFHFPAITLEQLVSVYEKWAGKPVTAPPQGWPTATIHADTSHPVTKEEAMRIVEAAMKEQAHVTIRRGPDGKLFGAIEGKNESTQRGGDTTTIKKSI